MKNAFVVLFLTATCNSFGQQGKFLDIYGFGQQTTIANYFDVGLGARAGLGSTFSTDPTYSYGGAVHFNYLVGEYVGWKSGLVYSRYAQNTSSRIESSTTRDSISYSSRLSLDQLSIPAILDFSISSSDDTRVYFNLGMGFQINYLLNGAFDIETNPPYDVQNSFELGEYYDRLNFSYLMSIELRIRLGKTESYYLLLGINYDKLVGGIEKKGLNFGQNDPKELIYPLGTLKDYDYDVSASRNGYNTKIDGVALRIGLSIRLSN